MPPFFPNAKMELYAYNQSTGEYTEWGERLPEYTLRNTVVIDLQPLSPKSSMEIFGKILQDTYVAFMDIDTEIYDNDLVVIDDVKYSIVGSVEVWNHLIKHKKITIQKQRKQ